MYSNENLVLQKLLNGDTSSPDDLMQILMKLEQLAFFNQFIEKFFKGSQRDSLLNLCGHLRMERFHGGEVIFTEGDASNDKLYIIFNGQVVLLRAKKFETFVEVPQDQAPPSKAINKAKLIMKIANTKYFAQKMMNQLISHHTKENECISQHDLQQLNEKYGESVRILRRGDGFGEVALLKNTPRGLTACAHTKDVFLVILKKPQFELIKYKFAQTMKEKKALIFSKFQVQNAYSTALLESIAYSFEVESFSYNQYLTKQGQQSKVFYLIQSGDVLLTQGRHKICMLGKGQFVGEEIVFNSFCEFTAQVTSQTAIVMVISRNEFLQKFPTECRSQLNTEYRQKLQFRQEFQIRSSETEEILTPRSQKKCHIRIKSLGVRSKEHRRSQIDIDEIIQQKQRVFGYKYSKEKQVLTIEDFEIPAQKQPKLPEYLKTKNVLTKSLKQDLLKSFRRSRYKTKLTIASSQQSFRISTNDITDLNSARSHFHLQTHCE